MNEPSNRERAFAGLGRLAAALGIAAATAAAAPAQPRAPSPEGGLLFNGPANAAGLTLDTASFLYQPLPPEMRRELQKEDIVTVIVDYRSSTLSEGEAETRKTANFNAVLADWIGFDGKSIFAAPQRRGDPTVSGNLNSQVRAEGDLELRDSLTFRIAATVVDIRPNGNLVLEAHRNIRNNDEVWRTSLTGTVSRQAILPDRTVSSDAIVGLQIDKYELGQVRNAYAPGWLNLWWGRNKPF